jgi:hypothetical protein
MYYVMDRGMQFIYKREVHIIVTYRRSTGTSSVLHVSRIKETVHRMSCCRINGHKKIWKCIPAIILALQERETRYCSTINTCCTQKRIMYALRLLTDDWRQFATKSCHLSGFYAGIVTATYFFYETSCNAFSCRLINI